MKKTILSFLLVGSFFVSSFADAQDNTVTLPIQKFDSGQVKRGGDNPPSNAGFIKVADVDIFDAKIVSQNSNEFEISFDLHNGEGVQPQIVYAVNLKVADPEKQDGFADRKIFFDDVVSLNQDETLHKNINYTASKNLSGSYNLTIEARNYSGLPFAEFPLGLIKLDGTGQILSLSDCFFTVQGEEGDKHYEVSQGVDVLPYENLVSHCKVENKSNKDIKAFVNATDYIKSSFGIGWEESGKPGIDVSAGQKKDWQFTMQKKDIPQDYVTTILFKDEQGNNVSNLVEFVYVESGLSATIDNLYLDKNFYETGDIASISLLWSTRADSIPGLRKGMVEFGSGKLNLSILDGNGNLCAEMQRDLLARDAGLMKIPLNILKTCQSPQIKAQIVGSDGKIIGQGLYLLNSKNEIQPQKSEPASLEKENDADKTISNASNRIKGVMLSIAGLIVLLILFYFLKKKKNIGLTLFIGLILLSGFNTSKTQAATYRNNMWCSYVGGVLPVDFTYSLNKATYAKGESMTLNASSSRAYSTAGLNVYGIGDSLGATINGSYKMVIDNYQGSWPAYIPEPSYSNMKSSNASTYTAQNAPGNYAASLAVTSDMYYYGPYNWCWFYNGANLSLSYKVAAAVDNGCAASTCVGQTCNNTINPKTPGTKLCDNGCAANTCVGQTCNNTINPFTPGTKLCDNGCAANTCVGQTCNNTINPLTPGTKSDASCCTSWSAWSPDSSMSCSSTSVTQTRACNNIPSLTQTQTVPGGTFPLSGVCGSANNTKPTSPPPSGTLCSTGSPSPATLSGSGPWNWTCGGICGGASVSCKTLPNQNRAWKEVAP